jgi:hypothetical protein
MQTYRWIFRFNWGQVAGWSEEYFVNLDDALAPSVMIELAQRVGVARAQFMSRNCVVEDCRINNILTPDTVLPIGLNIIGSRGSASGAGLDTGPEPVMACARVKAGGGGGKSRVLHLRGLADDDVRDGLLTTRGVVISRINSFLLLLRATMKASTQRANFTGTRGIGTINGQTFKVTLDHSPALAYAIGNTVSVQTNVTGNGPRVNALGIVTDLGEAPDFITLNTWSHGNCSGGFIRKVTYSYPQWTAFAFYAPNYVTYKKTGRAFSPFRGRASPHR